MGGQLTVEAIEAFLMSRGVLKPSKTMDFQKHSQSLSAAEKKEQELYYLCNESSFLNPALNDLDDKVQAINDRELAEDMNQRKLDHMDGSEYSVQIQQKKLQEGLTIGEYKQAFLDTFKAVEDPFGIEFTGESFDYEQNPTEPTKPQKTV
mmetsp:Transcript_19425/g.29851  ORF Transcript_19425/g.29851 Transcript_19425/m.29851 type:complete len:150 (+) Transcript_19425:251-700(+)